MQQYLCSGVAFYEQINRANRASWVSLSVDIHVKQLKGIFKLQVESVGLERLWVLADRLLVHH